MRLHNSPDKVFAERRRAFNQLRTPALKEKACVPTRIGDRERASEILVYYGAWKASFALNFPVYWAAISAFTAKIRETGPHMISFFEL